MNYIEQARKLRPLIEQAAQSLDDKTASKATTLFGGMKHDGSLIKAGTRVNWGRNAQAGGGRSLGYGDEHARRRADAVG